eukprot:CAMPEP_0185263488 /NCGR_PEP_ID=MMETSP1359-20130426/15234_1 /TAXON_ID=552665 /ORGANISM="Bigelowiella longifila, Strain CCMP242" /LENGTH=155 /DNA_ID=CAMNT_0027851065 /DNA_START=30 /DNA_END=497 /DNA_ORIENTATION=-
MALLASLLFLSSRSNENQMSLSISGRTGLQPMSSMGRGVACHAAGKGKPYNVQVVVGNDPEPVAIKKFTRQIQQGGYVIEAKRRRFHEPKVERMKRKVKEGHTRKKMIRRYEQQELRAASRGMKPPRRANSYADVFGVENDPFADLFDNNDVFQK